MQLLITLAIRKTTSGMFLLGIHYTLYTLHAKTTSLKHLIEIVYLIYMLEYHLRHRNLLEARASSVESK
jgi:hypothetical protein